ncbi:MAG: hypothetical protein EBS01_10690, partial [Verrucomicrobia bacterium]|nr:hypothetical protein [Verrucomicrobiota bacterium]
VSGGTLNIDGGHAVGSGSILMTGGGLGTTSGSLITLSTNNTQVWAGSFAFSGGSLDMGTGIVTMTGDQTLTINSGSLFERGVIGGAFSLTKDGPGTLVLAGQNAYTGGTVLKGGVLLLNGTSILPSNSFSASGGLLDLGGGSYTFQALSLTGGSIANGTLSSASGYTLQSGSVLAKLSGSGGLLKNGSGILTLSGANDYSGTTSVVGGTLVLNENAYDASSVLSVGAAGAAVISGTNLSVASLLNSGAVRFSGSTGLITLGSMSGGGRLSFDSDATLNFAVQNSQVTVLGTLTADVTSGSVTAGVLNPDSAVYKQVVGGLITTTNPSGVSRVPSLSGGTFVLGGTLAVSSGSYTGGGITGAGKLDQVDPSGTLVVNGGNTNVGSLGVAGTLLFTGASAVGVTTNNGSLEFRSTASVGLLAGAGTTTFTGASTSIGTLSSSTIKGNSVLTVSSGTYSGTIGGSIALVKSGSDSLTLGGSSSYTGGTRLTQGTLNINNAAAIGSGSLTIGDGSTLGNTSGGSVSISGVTRINAGSFTFNGNAELSFGSTTPIVLGSNVVWTVNSSTLSLGGVVSGVGYSLSKAGAGRLSLSGTNTFSGGLTVFGGTLAVNSVGAIGLGSLVMRDGTTLELVGDTALSSFALEGSARIVTSGGSVAFSGTFSPSSGEISQNLSGAGALVKSGDSVVVLSGTNTYGGGTSISSGTLDLRNSSALSTGSLVISGGNLDAGTSGVQLSVSSQVWSGSFGFLGTNDLNLGAGSVTVQQVVNINAQASTLTADGIISGSGGISKSGAGTVKLTSGTLSYTGQTIVSEGTLRFAPTTSSVQVGALLLSGSAQVSVDSNKLLKLTGIVSSGGSLTGAGSIQVGTASVSAG